MIFNKIPSICSSLTSGTSSADFGKAARQGGERGRAARATALADAAAASAAAPKPAAAKSQGASVFRAGGCGSGAVSTGTRSSGAELPEGPEIAARESGNADGARGTKSRISAVARARRWATIRIARMQRFASSQSRQCRPNALSCGCCAQRRSSLLCDATLQLCKSHGSRNIMKNMWW